MYTHWESEGKCQNGTVWYIGRMCVRCEIEPEVYRVHWHGTYYIAWGPEWCISVALTSERGEQWLAIPREWQSNLKGVLSQAHICFFGRKKAKKSKSDRVNFSEDVCLFRHLFPNPLNTICDARTLSKHLSPVLSEVLNGDSLSSVVSSVNNQQVHNTPGPVTFHKRTTQ